MPEKLTWQFEFSYEGLSLQESIKHFSKFTSDIWQIHPFSEGNTRATAVFMIKYMRTLGLKVENDVFKKYSWYFRNALVQANYNDLKNGIHATTKYLEMFFSNLLLGTDFELKNRYLHINYSSCMENNTPQSAELEPLKGNNCTLDCTLDELWILKTLYADPKCTLKELADKLGLSERSIKTRVAALKEKAYLKRVNGRRSGHWVVLVDISKSNNI